jgi:hypothetical protein
VEAAKDSQPRKPKKTGVTARSIVTRNNDVSVSPSGTREFANLSSGIVQERSLSFKAFHFRHPFSVYLGCNIPTMSVSFNYETEQPTTCQTKQRLVAGRMSLNCETGPLMMRLPATCRDRACRARSGCKMRLTAIVRGPPVSQLKVRSHDFLRQSQQ